MRRGTILILLACAMLVTAAVFYVDPQIDLDTAFLFYEGQNRFVGQGAGDVARRIFYWIPSATLAMFAVLYMTRRLGLHRRFAPTGRGLVMLALSFALGPGLLANTVLKDHSHRPRPHQTLNFGGEQAFRPFYTFDGACERNCSFVSGEGAAAAWTVAPALLVPPAIRAGAIAAALLFATAAGTLRMAFGAHYLSDTIFAVLFTWTTIWVVWGLLFRRSEFNLEGGNPSRRKAPPDA